MTATNDFWDATLKAPLPIGNKAKPWKSLGKDDGKAHVLLIDGDIIAYRAAAPCEGRSYDIIDNKSNTVLANEKYKKKADKVKATYERKNPTTSFSIVMKTKPEPEAFALYNVDNLMKRILDEYPGSFVKVYLTGNVNFRTELSKTYKANRSGSARPSHLAAAKQHLINKYLAILEEPYEADDLMGIDGMDYRKIKRGYTIASIDKDLNCIPGDHYNFVKKDKYTYSEDESIKFFYTQVLTGDTTDNIAGCKGYGPVKAVKALKGDISEKAHFLTVMGCFAKIVLPNKKPGEEISKEEYMLVEDAVRSEAELLWILQEKGIMWNPPMTVDDVFELAKQYNSGNANPKTARELQDELE